jgi:polysaccharide biosynthesis transport protein
VAENIRGDDEGPRPPEGHLWDYVHVVLRRRTLVVAVFLAVACAAAVRSFLTRPVYQATAQILIERDDPNVLSFKGVTEEKAGGGIDDYYQTQYKLLQSRTLARHVVETSGLLNDAELGGPRTPEQIAALRQSAPGMSPEMEGVVDAFLGRVRVQPVRNSRLVSVSFEAFRPELAATAANALSKAYIQQALDLRSGTSAEAGEWLGTQIAEQRKKVDELTARMRAVEQKDGIVNVEERRQLLDQRLKELGSALNDRKTERLQKEALWGQMRHAPSAEELPEAMRSPMIQSLRISLADQERRRALLLERYMDQHPEVVKIGTEISETKARIRSEAQRVVRSAENDYKAAAAQEGSVAAALEIAKSEALDMSRRSGPYDSQKRELDAALQVLQSLLSRNKETDVAQELKSSNIRIVDAAAVPRGPIRPQKSRDVGFGLLLGAVLSIGLAFFLDYLDNTLKTPDDVRHHLGVPFLGVIPDAGPDRAGGMLVSSKRSRDDPFVEGFRVLRTALEYSWPEATPRVVMVTSTAPGEGKTVTALNLALTLASLDQRVLLIDADLRKPKTHSVLKLKRTPGLTDVLVGRALSSRARHAARPAARGHRGAEPRRPPVGPGDAGPAGGAAYALPLDHRGHAARRRRGRAAGARTDGRRDDRGGGRRDGAAQGGRAQPGAPGRDARPHPGRRAEPRAGREALLLLRALLRLLRRGLRSRGGSVRGVRKGGLHQCEARARLGSSFSRPVRSSPPARSCRTSRPSRPSSSARSRRSWRGRASSPSTPRAATTPTARCARSPGTSATAAAPPVPRVPRPPTSSRTRPRPASRSSTPCC